MNSITRGRKEQDAYYVETTAFKIVGIIIWVILLAGMIAVTSYAAEDEEQAWTSTDTALQTAFVFVTAMDWAQTLHMARNPDRYEEGNPLVRAFIGRHPSEGKVNAFIGTSIILHTYVAVKLPKEYRTIWQAFWIGVETSTVASTVQTGIKLHF